MKNLIKNYIDLLNIDTLKEFALKSNINLTDNELNYLLNLVKNNFEDILKDDTKFLEDVKNNVNQYEFKKIRTLYLYYKNRYKGYLF